MSCLEGRIVLSVDFRCKKTSSGVVAKNRADVRRKREWMKGSRSVGSVFRNPEGKYAGKLIEDCGLKGFTVGGVTISDAHANIFVNDGTGTSSDMLCLVDMVAAEVRAKCDVVLEREVVILE
jgi:UDP-N-acetylmuramate dehydrogenase